MKYAIAAVLMMWVSVQAQGTTREEACAEYVAAYKGQELLGDMVGRLETKEQIALSEIFAEYADRLNRAEQPGINRLTDQELTLMKQVAEAQRIIRDVRQARDWPAFKLAHHALLDWGLYP